MNSPDAAGLRRSIEAVWRIESARLIARLARLLHDVGAAEEFAQDALVTALEQWPQTGIPANPAAWLMVTARNRAIDALRRQQLHARALTLLAASEPCVGSARLLLDDEEIGDDLLRLVFIACHPVLSMDARAALALRLLAGLTVSEIARAFLVTEATVQQRIVRAKRTLAAAHVPFELPAGPQRAQRLGSVLEVIYLIFNEGYAATAGERWLRPEVCDEALRLGRILARLMPLESEVHGLLALMELQASRNRARSGSDGAPVLLLEQNRALWDPLFIHRGLAALTRASECGAPLGPYALQAAIAACHARARTPEATNWPEIVALYDALLEMCPSPVVALNRAVAVAMSDGPAVALPLVEALQQEPQFEQYHLLPSVRGDLLQKLGRMDEARQEFVRAASLTRNEPERALLLRRSAACALSAGGAAPREQDRSR
jgi:RNA polymerase sigma factor (sigma-70 family)